MRKSTDVETDAARHNSSNTDTYRRLNRLSNFMDRSITLPGGFKIGWDGIIGIVPGIGDLIGMGVSIYIMLGAMRLGASKTTLVRMLGNIGIESVIGAIPFAGDIFDLYFRANSRNMKILDSQFQSPDRASQLDTRWLIGAILVLAALALLVLYLAVLVISGVLSVIF